MKKVLIFVMSLTLLVSVNTKAKAGVGVLHNVEYNKHELAEFQQALLNKISLKSGIITITQTNMIEVYKKHIALVFPGENFDDVVKNSTVEILPSDFQNNHKVGYLGADNTDGMDWFSRPPKTELGAEEGLKYKGKFWASKYCWNPIFPTSSPASQQTTYTPPPQQNPGTGNSGGGNTNTITINPGSNQSREMSASEFYMSYSMGRNDRQTDLIVDANIFKDIQNSKQCCQTGVASGQMMFAAMPVGYGGSVNNNNNNSGGSQNSGNQTLTIKNEANGWDKVNTIANVVSAGANLKMAIWGVKTNGPDIFISGINSGGGFNGGTGGTGGPRQGGFNSGSSGGYYDNGGGSTGGGGTNGGFGGLLGN